MKGTLAKFLGALPIECASEITFNLITEKYPTLSEILSLTPEQIAVIGSDSKKSIGESRAQKIYNSLHSEYIQNILQQKGRWVSEEPTSTIEIHSISKDNFFSGKKVCFTGTAPVPRKELTQLLKDVGAIVKDSVTKDLDYLLIEDINSESSKAKSARKNNVTIIPYDVAMNYISGKE